MVRPKRIELAPQVEIGRRPREIQLLINIAEPDPEYQPGLLTDEASLLDAVGTAPDDIQRRLDAYFGVPLGISLRTPIWQYVDAIKRHFPGWPDDWPPAASA
jgi:hypothetical protein